MGTNTNQAEQNNQPAISTLKPQTIDNLSAVVKSEFTRYYFGNRTPQEDLVDRLEGLSRLFDDLARLDTTNLSYLNRAVSFYLIHSPNDMWIKERVIEDMNKAMIVMSCLTKCADEVSYWDLFFDSLSINVRKMLQTESDTETHQETQPEYIARILTECNESTPKSIKEITEQLENQGNTATKD